MKVYFVENENPNRTSSGGIMSFLVNLSNYLLNKNIETVLIGSGKKNDNHSLFTRFISVSPNNNLSNIIFLKCLFTKLNIHNSIVHVQRPEMILPFILKNNTIICSLHGSHDVAVFDKKGFINGIIYFFIQSVSIQFANVLIAVDLKTKNHYLRFYPWLRRKLLIIPIGVNTYKFRPLDRVVIRDKYGLNGKKNIIFVGRIDKEKNLIFLLEVFKKLNNIDNNTRFIIVGSGNEENNLKSFIKTNKIKDVVFWGEIVNDHIPKIMNCADVIVLASKYEGNPTVIKEALACNIPVVSVDVGDVKSIIKDIDGCYIADRNIDDFTRKIQKVLSEKRKINTREKILEYDCSILFEKIYNILLKYKK